MAALIDADVFAAASERAMRENLTPPLRAGALELPLDVDPGGNAAAEVATREPLLLAWPLSSLAGEGLRLQATVTPAGGDPFEVTLEFAPYTEAGAALPVHRPPVDPGSRLAAPFSVKLTLSSGPAGDSPAALPVAQVAERVGLGIVEGVTGRMLYLLGAEKARMRRSGRELVAQLRLVEARDDALDRHGADLGVPRFAERLEAAAGQISTAPEREGDAEYRRRLALYRPFLMANRGRVLELLNGTGAAPDPNAGALAELGVAERFELVEASSPVSVAIHVIAAGGDDPAGEREALLGRIREVHLIWPRDDDASNAAHAARFLAQPLRERQQELRQELRKACEFDDGAAQRPALAPLLAEALARLGAVRTALGVSTPLRLTRAQDGAGGSRYELGLGADLSPPPAEELERLGQAAGKVGPSSVADPELRALIAGLEPRDPDEDPDGAWLLGPCGLGTAFRVTAGALYVSHLATLGLSIEGPDTAASGDPIQLQARDEAPGDAASNAVLGEALDAALAAWPGPAPETLAPGDAASAWAAATPRPAGDRALEVFAAAGLPALPDPQPAAQRLAHLPSELVRTLRLAGAQSGRILGTGEVGAALAELTKQVEALREHGLVSVLPAVSGADVLLAVAVIGLPEAGLNLAARSGVGFRWRQVPIRGPRGKLGPGASRTSFAPGGEGVVAIVCLGYRRRDLVDPGELRVELPEGGLLGLPAYEFLMNALERAHPLGIAVNTYSIRRRHVDLTGGGMATPLSPRASRTYRRFQRPRLRGEGAGEDPTTERS